MTLRPLILAAALALAALPSTAAPASDALVVGSEHAGLPASFDASFRHGYSQVNGVRLHYVVGGKGPPVLLVPGWPETWLAWRHVMPKLAEDHTVIAVDTRGMGASGRPPSGYDTATVASDLFALMDHLGHARFQLVGHDIGVWIGYAMAADRPERIDRLALLDSNLPGVTPSPPVFQPRDGTTHSWHFMFNQLDDLPEALTQGREREFLTWLYANYALKPEALASEDYIRAYSAPGAMRAGFAYYRALPQTIAQNEARMKRRLSMPILALGGAAGTGATAETTLRPQADALDGGVLADCGHYVPEECPGPLLDRLKPFLAAR